VLRGGFWFSDARYCRATNRIATGDPAHGNVIIGFRSVLPPGQ
jgi:formylglycine-generating enzyme required for sulfatase activity